MSYTQAELAEAQSMFGMKRPDCGGILPKPEDRTQADYIRFAACKARQALFNKYDVDSDGVITIKDIAYIQQHLVTGPEYGPGPEPEFPPTAGPEYVKVAEVEFHFILVAGDLADIRRDFLDKLNDKLAEAGYREIDLATNARTRWIGHPNKYACTVDIMERVQGALPPLIVLAALIAGIIIGATVAIIIIYFTVIRPIEGLAQRIVKDLEQARLEKAEVEATLLRWLNQGTISQDEYDAAQADLDELNVQLDDAGEAADKIGDMTAWPDFFEGLGETFKDIGSILVLVLLAVALGALKD